MDEKPAIADPSLFRPFDTLATDIETLVDHSRSIKKALDDSRPHWGKVELVVTKNGLGPTGLVAVNYDATGMFV